MCLVLRRSSVFTPRPLRCGDPGAVSRTRLVCDGASLHCGQWPTEHTLCRSNRCAAQISFPPLQLLRLRHTIICDTAKRSLYNMQQTTAAETS